MTARNKPELRRNPRQERSRATVDAILSATAQLLLTTSLESMKTSQVARRAGVSIGTVYQYFPDKEALAQALLARFDAEVLRTFEDTLARSRRAPLPRLIAELARKMVEVFRANIPLHRALQGASSALQREEPVRQLRERVGGALRLFLENRREPLRPRSFEVAIFVTVRAVDACTQAALLERPELLNEDSLADELADLICRYWLPEGAEARRARG